MENPQSWHIIDARGQVLGRLASQIATILIGKRSVDYAPHKLMNDYIVVLNARHVVLTGNKRKDKTYDRYTGYPGGLKKIPFLDWIKNFPIRPLEHAVRGMLPKNRLGRQIFKKLYIYPDAEHGQHAQKPIPMEVL